MSSHVLDGQAPKQTRKRSVWLAAAALLSTLVGLGAISGYLAWANRVPPLPPESRSYPQPNGLDHFLAASWKLPRFSPRDPFQADLAALRREVNAQSAALRDLRAAVALPFMSPLIRSDRKLPTYSTEFTSAAWLFVAKARTELADGRAASALGWALDAVELGGKSGEGAPAFFQRQAQECSAFGTGMAELCLPYLSEAELSAASRRLDRLIAQLPSFAEIVEEDRRFLVASMHSALAQPAAEQLRPGSSGPLDLWDGYLRYAWSPKPARLATTERDAAALAAYAQKSWPERRRASLPVARGRRMMVDELGDGYATTVARLRLLRMEFALQAHHRRTGAYPEALGEVVGCQRLPSATTRLIPTCCATSVSRAAIASTLAVATASTMVATPRGISWRGR